MSTEPLLEIRDLHVSYGHIHAVKGLSFSLAPGSITSLIGANGAGKSTTLMAISRVVPAQSGEIIFKGESLANVSPSDVVARGIVQVPEGRRVFPRLTVRENLHMGAFLVRDRELTDRRLEEVLEIFPILRERADQKSGTLSGGEQQMLALGRAMMGGPKLLLLDEPSLGLAPIIIERIFEVLLEINRRGTTILLVEQNARLALDVSSYAYVLETGRIALGGTAGEVGGDPKVVELYLGA